MSRSRVGQCPAQWSSTFHPPPSNTNVTITFGGDCVPDGGGAAPGNTRPALSLGKAMPIWEAIVGAMSARVTRSVCWDGAIRPGAWTTSGTRSRYIQTLAWLVRGSRRTRDVDSFA